MSIHDRLANDQLSVLMAPDYRESNPYQTQLIAALGTHNVSVNGVKTSSVAPLLDGCRRYGVPDIVHIHWIHTFIGADRTILRVALSVRLLFELVLVRLFGADIVWTVHNVTEHESRTPQLERTLRHVVARFVTRIIVHCEAAKPIIKDAYRLPTDTMQKVRVIPHGNYVESYPNQITKTEARAELDIPPNVVVFVYFGIIREYKNVPTLIETFRSLEDDDVRLLVVGNPWNDTLKTDVTTACGDDKRIQTVLEYVPADRIQVYMNAADTVVLPFQTVLTSGSALLGMSFGRALVVPNVGCVGSVVDDAGAIAYDPTEPNALKLALQETLRRRTELPAMGRYNRAAVEQYDWASIASKTRSVYEQDTAAI